MRSRYPCFPVSLRKPERLFILLPSIVDRYSETYGPTDFEYCLLAALLGPNWSSLAIERVGWALRPRGIHACLRLRVLTGAFSAALVEQGSHPQPHSAKKTKGPVKGPLIFLAVGRVMGEPCSSQKKPPFGGFIRFEDAKVGLLVAFFCLLPDTHPFDHISAFKLESVLVSGYLA